MPSREISARRRRNNLIGYTSQSIARWRCPAARRRYARYHHGGLVEQGIDESRTGFFSAISGTSRCRPFDDLAATRIYQSDARGVVREDVSEPSERGKPDQCDYESSIKGD